MSRKIIITIDEKIGEKKLKGELNDSSVADLIWERLPMTVNMSRWGEEYYGSCGINAAVDETARDILEVGELAFWPPGSALCVFFGPTPVSTDGRPKAASEVIPVGRLTSDVGVLKQFGGSITMEITRDT